ncbi:MAG TPA: glycosyltransferase family 4 protein [Polyangiaceae bacterium]|nr:glycosyltransferase family 4 protein [Polyangiaceae bacterium]
MVGTRNARVLTFNCHEGYVHLLGKLGLEMDVVDGLPGRYTGRWDERMRPVPPRARLIGPGDLASGARYDAVIAHNVLDLLDARGVDAPKILVLHVNLDARAVEEPNGPAPAEMSRQVQQYLSLIGGIAVAVSKSKRDSWKIPCDVVRPAVDPDEWRGYEGTEAALLRVANQVNARRARFAWSAHERIVDALPCKLVGHNPDIAGSEASRGWDHLREMYRTHRAYVHTADPALEDGYNLALLEAMGTGMPVVSTRAPESPVVDGENGFLDADPAVLHDKARRLLTDPDLARRLGARARECVLDEFSVSAFVSGWHSAIERAKDTFEAVRRGVQRAGVRAAHRGTAVR